MSTLSLNPNVIGRRLGIERKARGLTQQQLAQLVGVARTTIVAVEKGDRTLQPEEITRLSEAWNISVSDLVRDRPAIEPLVPQLLAALPAAGLSESDMAGITEAAETLRHLTENHLELERLTGRKLARHFPTDYESITMPARDAATCTAIRERLRLELGDVAVPNLRSILENEVGLRIFVISMPAKLAGMYAFDPDAGPLIALNAAHPAQYQLWALAREYYHFLRDHFRADLYLLSGGIEPRMNDAGRMKDLFASHFLMPETGLKRRFYDMRAARTDGVMPGDLLHLKRQYGVSLQSMMLRLEELKLLRTGTWANLSKGALQELETPVPADFHLRLEPVNRLPQHYVELAVEAYERADLTEVQLANMLECDLIGARREVTNASHERSISRNGAPSELEISLDQPLTGLTMV